MLSFLNINHTCDCKNKFGHITLGLLYLNLVYIWLQSDILIQDIWKIITKINLYLINP